MCKNYILKNNVRLRGKLVSMRFHQRAREVAKTQEEVLLEILKSQGNTSFAKKHSFATISNVDEFRKKIPIFDYEGLRPFIMNQDETKQNHINHEPHLFYAVTSGTTGTPKYIPVTSKALSEQKEVQMLFQYHLLRDCPGLLDGKILSIVSPAIEGTLPSGTPFGSTSGQIYTSLPRAIQEQYVVPFPVLEIEDYDLKYLTILRLALNEDNITYFTSANPSTFVRLRDLLTKHWDALIDDLASGSFFREKDLSPQQHQAVFSRLTAQPVRAKTLRGFKTFRGHVHFSDIWPQVRALAVWTGGNSGIFLEALRAEFHPDTIIRDLGYLSSEFRGTVPLLNDENSGVPTFLNHYFEFVEKDSWNESVTDFKGLHEVVPGKQYYIFITTKYGLYRYNMNDIVEVTGHYSNTALPLLRFVQKGKGVTSLTGEKLYESQVLQAVHAAEKEMALSSEFYMLCADQSSSSYVIFYQASSESHELLRNDAAALRRFKKAVDEQLKSLNLEYQAKQKSGRVGELRFCLLRSGAFDAYKRHKVSQGQREAQFKIVALQYLKEVGFDFFTWQQEPVELQGVKR